jgi:hypothetical protein
MKLDFEKLMTEIRTKGLDKKAEAQGGLAGEDEAMQKIAEDLVHSGKIFGRALVDGLLEKAAEAPVGATGAASSSEGDPGNDDSLWKKISDKVMNFQGHESAGSAPSVPGTNPNVVAESTQPAQEKKPNPPEPTGG